jgi:3-dehydroquinate synthase
MPVWFDVRAEATKYAVIGELDVLATRASAMRDGLVLADDYFAGQLSAQGLSAIVLNATEASKSFDAIGDVIVRMRQAGATRDTHLWAIGGGAIQDVAGFVASIYMRGISWTYVPTTLLGMVDSCIGGKSSINIGAYKNIVGTFHPPSDVLIDPLLTASLSTEQRVAGLVEAAKICYCRSAETFDSYLALSPQTKWAPNDIEPIIGMSLRSKQWFIEIDEFDRAERLLLNLGHTFGHALEGASGYRLSHGIAVGIGVLCALELSRNLLKTPLGGAAPRLDLHMRELLRMVPALPAMLREVEVPIALDRLKADKKHESSHYRLITFDEAGCVRLTRLPKAATAEAAISTALRDTLESFS